MHPTLAVFALPWVDWTVQVDAYPLAHLLAFIAMVTLTVRRYARDVGPPAPVLDVFLVAVPAALLGAHYVAGWTSGHPPRNPLDTLAVYRALDAWSSAGKSAYGGLVAGIGAAALAARLWRLPVGALFDAAAPGLATGAAIARVGCFLGGCCYGRPTASFLGVHFPDGHLGRDGGAAVVLGQLLEIGGGGPLGTWSRIGLGADRLLDGRLDDAVAEWRTAATHARATPWGAQAELAVGLGEVVSGRPDAAIAAFRAAVDAGEGETVAFAAVSLGRVLAASGDAPGAETSFRRVLADHPRSGVADDAALGLARMLVDGGRLDDASAVLADAR